MARTSKYADWTNAQLILKFARHFYDETKTAAKEEEKISKEEEIIPKDEENIPKEEEKIPKEEEKCMSSIIYRKEFDGNENL